MAELFANFALWGLLWASFSGLARGADYPVDCGKEVSEPDDGRRTSGSGKVVQVIVKSCSTPSPCTEEGGTSEQCRVAIGPPEDLCVTSTSSSQCPRKEALLLGWKASPLGIEFLRGFYVRVHSEDGSDVQCQRLALRTVAELDAGDASMEFSALVCVQFSTAYSLLLYAYPFPHDSTYQLRTATAAHTSRACEDTHDAGYCSNCMNYDGYAKESCIRKWVPENITVSGTGSTMNVTFSKAPDSYGISSYTVLYTRRQEVNWQRVTVHPLQLQGALQVLLHDLSPRTDYCIQQIFSSLPDSTRKAVMYHLREPDEFPILAVVTVASVLLVALAVLLQVCVHRRCLMQKGPLVVERKGLFGSLGSPSSPAPQSCLQSSPPSIFLCYSPWGGPQHTRLALALASYLQLHCACQVTLDLWEELSMAREGHMTWLSERIGSCRFVMVLCSQSLKQSADRTGPPGPQPLASEQERLFLAATSLAGEQLLQARLTSGDLSKFITVSFSQDGADAQIPRVLELAAHYRLMQDFPKLFSHLHSLRLDQPGYRLHVGNIAPDDYYLVRSGYLLYCAINGTPQAPDTALAPQAPVHCPRPAGP
ncbi:interleukin-17 receptor D-like isoform X3 [Lepisosteus oculatus]|uniref:interleukin-17 receptor D-like isoform X3 n=1 Tax=Lepisosteus oculatus TaxID=7918 RepID=UPI0035F5081D